MPQQTLSTELQLDALLASGFEDAFSSASDLMSDLKKESAQLQKQLGTLGSEHKELDKLGKATDGIRDEMRLLEAQIRETNRATERFGEARSHFRKASIGARALKSDLIGILNTAKNAALAIAGISAASIAALKPDQELLEFDQTINKIGLLAPELDASGIKELKSEIRGLSNDYGIAAVEIASQHQQLTADLGFEMAQQTIETAIHFQTVTGLAITDLEEELDTARVSLGIDTPDETKEFLTLLAEAKAGGIKIDNLDLGDLETLRERTGQDVFGEAFQREFLTTIGFRQVDSFQYGDYSPMFQEEINLRTNIIPGMKDKELEKALSNMRALEKYGIRAEEGLVGAMSVYRQLSEEQRKTFAVELEPALGPQLVEIITRAGTDAYGDVVKQLEKILGLDLNMEKEADKISSTWSIMWERIGDTGGNALGILREQFAGVFGPPILSVMGKLFKFIDSHQDEIRDFFTGVRDNLSPVISKIWASIRDAYPDIRAFALEVWGELQRHWQAIAPAAQIVGDGILNIAKAVGSFLKEHPRLVATVISGAVAWKTYSLASQGVSVIGNLIGGATKLAQGHIHRLNAIILENARLQKTLQPASLGISRVFSTIGRAAFAAVPAIGTMGASLMAAIVPALPVMLPVIAAAAGIAGMGLIIYRNWEPIKAFFADNFETIRNTLMVVFPALGLLVGFAGVIRDNWEGIKEFFSTLWETVKLAFQVAFEGIQFLALSALVGIRDAWSSITGFFGELWSGVHGFFLDTPLAPVFEWMVDRVKAVVIPLLGFFTNFWEKVSETAGKALGWITGFLDGVNEFLGRWSDDLREENTKLREELNVSGHVKEDVLVDVKSGVQAENPIIESPAAQIATPESPISQPAIEKTQILAQPGIQKPGVLSVSELETIIRSTETEKPVSTAPILPSSPPMLNLSTEMSTKSPRMSMPTKSLENIGLGILEETRKQTSLMEQSMSALRTPLAEIPATDMPTAETPLVRTSQTVSIESPTIKVPPVEIPVIEMPTVKVLSVEKTVVEKPSIEMPMVEVFAETGVTKPTIVPVLPTAPVIEAPSTEVPAIEMPKLEVLSVEKTVVEKPSIEMPTVEVFGETGVIEPTIVPVLPTTPVIEAEAPIVQIAETPAIEMPEVIFDTPSMEIEDYIIPSEAAEREAQSEGASAEQEGTTAPVIVEQHNHFYITQHPDQDEEALARRIVDILDEQRDTYYVQ